MKSVILIALVLAASQVCLADQTENYGWEGTDTILGSWNDIDAEISTDPVHGGSQSLHLTDQTTSGTPQAFVALVADLQMGDSVYAEFWRYDTTPGSSPSARIWGHWIEDPYDIDSYLVSAGGNEDYGPGTGWDLASWGWTADADSLHHLVIECRTYSNPGDEVWIDDMSVTAPDGAIIVFPGELSLECTTWGDIKATF